jgi:hypothetical protein
VTVSGRVCRSASWRAGMVQNQAVAVGPTQAVEPSYYRSKWHPLLRRINAYLMRWLQRKYRRLRTSKKALACWQSVTSQQPRLLAHWPGHLHPGDQDNKSRVTGDCHARIRGSRGPQPGESATASDPYSGVRDDHAVGEVGDDAEVVPDHEHHDATLGCEFLEEVEDLGLYANIERRGRLKRRRRSNRLPDPGTRGDARRAPSRARRGRGRVAPRPLFRASGFAPRSAPTRTP